MKVKTFILTFLMMMSSPFLFGQHWVDPDLGTNNTMPISATITLDGELQTDESYQVAAFHGNTLLEVQSIIAFVIPNGGGTLYHVDMDIPFKEGKTSDIYFKLFNGINEYVSSTKIDWNENGYLHTNPLEINFKAVAQIEGTEYDVVYSSLQEAFAAAQSGETITLVANTDENILVGNENLKPYNKSVKVEGNGLEATGGWNFGRDDNNADNGEITINNVKFSNKGVAVVEFKNVTITNCVFDNITSELAAIRVICDDSTDEVTLTGNTITNVSCENASGIRVRGAKDATVSDNVITNVNFTSILFEGTTNNNLVIKNNVIKNWAYANGSAANDGRAIRIAKGEGTCNVEDNAMIIDYSAPEEFVKVDGNTSKVSFDKNYWDAEEPKAPAHYNTVVEVDSYYAAFDETTKELSDLRTINYVAQIGDVKYSSLQDALNYAVTAADEVTVTLLDNINLQGKTWTPVYFNSYIAQGTNTLIIDGKDKTISNLTDMLFSGTWTGKKLEVKNLTISEANINHDVEDTNNVGVGAIVGNISATEKIVFDNVKLVESHVEGGHWTGGLIGYAAGYSGNDGPVFTNIDIKNCEISGSTIVGKGSVGGVVGHATGDAWTSFGVEATTISDNTITSTGSSNNKAGIVMGTIGAAGTEKTTNNISNTGGVFVSVTESGNTAKSNETAITRIYGRQGSSTGILTLTKGGLYQNNPIEENVPYAVVDPGFKLEQNTDETYGVVEDPDYGMVAKIGETRYATLAAAFVAAAQTEELTTIELLPVTIEEDDDINTVEKTIKLPATLKNVIVKGADNNTSILKNLTIQNAQGGTYDMSNITFDGVVFDNSNIVLTGWRTGFESLKNLIVKNCIFSNIVRSGINLAAVHINVAADKAVNGFTFINNVIDGVTGAQNSGIYGQFTGEVIVKDNVINNVAFRPYVIQLTTNDGVADNFTVTGNTFSGSTAGRAQGLGNNAEGTDAVTLTVSNNIFKDITDAQQICYWNFNEATTTATLEKNYYDIDVMANPNRIYYNSPAQNITDLSEMGIFPIYTELKGDGTINEESLFNPVAYVGTVAYETLAEAFACQGGTIVLLEDIELTEGVVVAADKTFTLDLNGKVVSGVSTTAASSSVITNNGNLTVQSSVEGGKITSFANNPDQNGTPAYANNTITNCGVLTLVSGTIENSTVQGLACYPIDNNSTLRDAIVNIQGGVVTGRGAIRQFANSETNKNEVNVTNGQVIGASYAIWIQNPSSQNSKEVKAALNISDGELGKILLEASAAYEIAISGGKISEVTFWETDDTNPERNASAFITGGTFDGDVSAYCAFGYTCQANGDGTYGIVETTSFEIPNLDRLIAFRNAVNAGNTFAGQTVTVTADINMESVANWTPIGTLENPFNGTFDGGNKTISNLNVNGGAYAGLFGYANSATIKNVKIENANVKGTDCVGVIAGNVYSTSLIDNCHVSGNIKVEGNTNVGGIVGKYYTKVKNSSVIGDEVAASYVKGVHVGANLEGDNIGGIMGHAGENNTHENNVVKNITISGTRKVGGLIGVTDQNTDVTNCVVENVKIETTAEAQYAEDNKTKAGHASLVGSYTSAGANDNGTVTNCLVKNVKFVNTNNVVASFGPITGGARGGSEAMLNPTGVTASGNTVYMTTITGSNNLFLMKAVAKIEETDYYTLDEAIAAANNQTVTVLENVELRNTLTIEAGKTVTLDLNGKTISVAITEQLTKSFAAIKNKGTLTVKDSGTEGKISVSYGGSSFGYGIGLYTISNEGGVLNIEGGIIENTATVATSMYDAIDNNSTLGETVLNISGGEVRCAQYIGVRQFANSTTKDNIVNVTGGKVLGGNTSIWMQNPGSNQPKATIAISEDANIEGRLLAGESEEFVFAVTGGTFTTDVTDFCAPGYVCKQNTDGTYGVFLGVAKIVETDVIYASLQAAITAAQSGNTIVLLADITENVTVSKSLTIDGANAEGGKFDYTGTMTANNGLTVTVQNIDFVGGGFDKSNKSTSGNYTIKNCTFKDDGDYAYAFRFKGASSVTIEDCTVKNYLYSFLYITASTNKVSVKNVTVEDCPSYAVYFASGVNTATIENLTVMNSNNGFVINNTANRALNLTNCIFVDVTTAINHSSGTNTVKCNLSGENNNFGTSALSEYATIVLAEANAKLTAQEGLDSNVTTTVEGSTVKYEEGTTTPGFGTYYVIPANVELVRGETSVGKFATIQEAIDAAEDGDKVVLLKDVDLSTNECVLLDNSYNTYFKVEGKAVTIDLKGKTISGEYASSPMLVGVFSTDNNGHLTLEDSSYDKTGAVNVTTAEGYTVYSLIANYEPGCSITINGGTYTLDKASDSHIYSGSTNGETEGVTVNGGTFKLENVGSGDNGKPWMFNVLGANNGNVVVKGGTFDADINHQFWANEVYVPDTLALQYNGDEERTWTVVESVAYVVEKATSTNARNRNVGYATIEDAIEAIGIRNTNKTVTMLQDVTLAESLTIEAGKEIILDLKGNDIDVVNDQVNFNINGKLTLNDETGAGVFTSRNHFVNEGAEFIVNGGTVQNVETATGGFPINLNGGSVTIKGGTVQAVNNANYAIGGEGGTLVIEGGTVKGKWGAVNLQSGNATIKDGTLEVTGTTGGHALYVAGDTEVTIEGGEFKPYVGDGAASYALVLNSENATVNVSGGMFHKGWGCVIVYAGDLSLTGGTFGSNMVITNNNPSESADINTFCAEGYGAIANANGTWTVMPVQEQSLVAGWNWYSSYLNIITPSALTTALGENGLEVKDQNDASMIYDQVWGTWSGSLTLDFAKMYMINTTEACELKLAADLLNPANYPVTLNEGWNWIGYPSNVSVSINDALKDLTPQEGDIIKTRNKGHAEYVEAWGGWIGALTHMIPGEGYMYRNTSGVEKQFIYNVESTRGTVEANYTAENNYWTPNVSKYPFNMTMTAVVDGMTDGNYEVAAFVNGEVRGSARPIYVEQLDAYVLFLTINGDEVEEMSFRLYDIDNDTEYDLNDRFNYSNNAHLGSVSEPYVFSRGTTGIGEAAMSNINIYPNPTTTGTEINLEATCDIVEVYNALGVKVAEYQNVDTIDALETAGIYVIRITNNGNVQNCRLVVK